ncbi:MAG: cupin domain-containing protein [Armatimonadetes bacterium]|nr:cupin domain-containing protein [Armatimonadota bacterium]MDE2207114.1 cupin domain-containing protein [Armatimonadota bacterium]
MEIVSLASVPPFTTKDGSTIRELLSFRNSEIAAQSLAEARLAPGGETTAHVHPATEEIYYLLSGIGLMAIENETRAVAAGDAIAIPPGKRHQIRNIGVEPLVLLCCCAPAYSDTDTILCDALLPSPESDADR